MCKSLREYACALGYWGFLVTIPIGLDAIGIYQMLHDTEVFGVPSWFWIIFASVLFLIIPFIAFHRVRKQRDALKKQEDNVEIEIRSARGGGAASICAVEFNLHVNNIPMQLARVELVVGNGDRIPCLTMPTYEILYPVETHVVNFGMTKATREYTSDCVYWTGKISVLAGGQEWLSREFDIIAATFTQLNPDREDSQPQ